MHEAEKKNFSLDQVFGVACALMERNGKYLLIKEVQRHIANHPDHGKWNLPGGRIDVGEDPRHAAEREAHEETGYHFKSEKILGVYSVVRKDLAERVGGVPHALKIVYLGSFEGQPGPITDDASEVRWFTRDEIAALSSQELRDGDIPKMIQDYEAGKHYPPELILHSIRQ